ncbi:O-antigen ligase family protein [Gallicola sp. Sow4_E12]|uniref:O-antigen ligase family protein n=1 Tax=Gallicola sp. Sow4_E12 TaxID=3438785 RepID=UPI003F9320FD
MLERFKNYDMDEKLIIITCIAMYLPFYIGFAFLAFNLFYYIYTNQIGKIVKEIARTKFLFVFIVYSIVVSVIHQNSYGLMASIGILIFCMFFLFYRNKLTKTLFKDSIRVIVIMTGLTFIATIAKYGILFLQNDMSLMALAEYSAENREISNYFNSNYYAMVCEMMIIVTGYLAHKSKKKIHRVLYICLTILAFGALILTGSRSGLATAVLLLVLMNLKLTKTKIGWIEVGIALFIGINIIGETGLFPRFGTMEHAVGLREKIWREALHIIDQNWLTGVGPLGIHSEVHSIGSRVVHHSHNIILDGLVNFGVMGIALIFPFAKRIRDEVHHAKKSPYYTVILFLTAVIIIHGMVDVTIFWHQTAFIYFVFAISMGKLYPMEEKADARVLSRNNIPVVVKSCKGKVVYSEEEKSKL